MLFRSAALASLSLALLASAAPLDPRDEVISSRDTVPKSAAAVLSQTNKYRAYHNAPALKWDNDLAAYAKANASACKLQISNGPYGENVAGGTGSFSYKEAVDLWYTGGNKTYNYSKPGFSQKTGTFTQLVWKSTKRLGCARVKCTSEQLGFGGNPNYPKYGYNIFCEYDRAGNIDGQYQKNVLPYNATAAAAAGAP